MLRRLSMVITLFCALSLFVVPNFAFAAQQTKSASQALLTGSMSSNDLAITYPYADANDDGLNDFALEVGSLTGSYVRTYLEPNDIGEPTEGYVTEAFSVDEGIDYFYRVSNLSNDDAVTFGSFITAKSGSNAVTVKSADMRIGDAGQNDAFDSDTVLNDFIRNKRDTGDLYLNIGPNGHLKLQVGETFSLYPMRCWPAIEGTNNAQVLQPDFDVEVVSLDGLDAVSAIEIANSSSGKHSWVIAGEKPGTSLVKVTYDSLVHEKGYGGLTDFSAIWPENTGLFIVTVGKPSNVQAGFVLNVDRNDALEQENESSGSKFYGTAAKVAGDALDAEFDVLYYSGDTGASYAFTPEPDVQVSVARGSVVDGALQIGDFTQEGVVTSADGTVVVNALKTGKHIIRVQKGDDVLYQVVRAKQVRYRIYSGTDVSDEGKLIANSDGVVVNAYTNGTSPITRAEYNKLSPEQREAYEPLASPGTTITLVFDKLYHPANKAPCCYNMTAAISLLGSSGAVFEQTVSPYGGAAQYTFASTTSCQQIKFKLPNEIPNGTYGLCGSLLSTGYGYGGYGSHRQITYESGYETSGNAPLYAAYFGQLPDIALDVVVAGGGDPDPGETAQAEADAFTLLVNEIGDVDLDAADRIAKARAAYDSLSDEALALVSADTVALLLQAEARLAALQDAHFDPVDIEPDCVRIVVENNTYPLSAGAPWEGMHLDKMVEIDSLNDTMRTLLDKALLQAALPESQGNAGYITSIDGLSEKDNGESSGWMCTLNGWFINAGLNEFDTKSGKVRPGDEIRLIYTSNLGPDVGSDFYTDSKELRNVATNTGTLSPTFNPTVLDYVLKINEDTTTVNVKPTPLNQNWQTRVYLGAPSGAEDAWFRLNDPIPIEDGSKIVIVTGDSSWPSMNTSDEPAMVYTITVQIGDNSQDQGDESDDPPAPDDTPTPSDQKEKSNSDVKPAPSKTVAPTTVTVNTARVTSSSIAKACKKAGTTPAKVKKIVLGKKVKRVAKRAFVKCKKATVIILKTKKLTKKSVLKCLTKSKVKTIQVKVGKLKTNKKYAKKYKKFFTKKNCGKKVRVKAS